MAVPLKRVRGVEPEPDLRPWVVSAVELFKSLPVGACFSSKDPDLVQIDFVKVSESEYRRADFYFVFTVGGPGDELHTWRYAEEVPAPEDLIDGPELARLREADAVHARLARDAEEREMAGYERS